MRILGDVHGKISQYIEKVQNSPYSICVGDVGFDYSLLSSLNGTKHKIVGGNHDNYNTLVHLPHYLGDFGMWHGIFFIRGALSIDRNLRNENVDWWAKEELTYMEGLEAIEAYKTSKPSIVVSHDCPLSILPYLCGNNFHKSRTNQLLQACLEEFRPSLWIFGHHHQSKKIVQYGVDFICLNELETMDI